MKIILIYSITLFVNSFLFCQETTKIGEQIWTTMNLNIDTFQNGQKIVEAKTKADWDKAINDSIPAWCYYDFNPFYEKIYGKMYNYYAITDKRELAPKGFHIPNYNEFTLLIKKNGGNKKAGINLKSTIFNNDSLTLYKIENYRKTKKLIKRIVSNGDFDLPPPPEEISSTEETKAKDIVIGWYGSEYTYNKNLYNFNAMPGGYMGLNTKFKGIGSYCHFWTQEGGYFTLYYNDSSAEVSVIFLQFANDNAFNVRLIKNKNL